MSWFVKSIDSLIINFLKLKIVSFDNFFNPDIGSPVSSIINFYQLFKHTIYVHIFVYFLKMPFLHISRTDLSSFYIVISKIILYCFSVKRYSVIGNAFGVFASKNTSTLNNISLRFPNFSHQVPKSLKFTL